jgi:outer membrane protein TolC
MIARIALLTAFTVAFGRGQEPVNLDDVIRAVQRHYPPLLAALAENDIADAEVLSAEGRFDPVIRGRFDSDSLGYYANRRADMWIEQPTSIQGLSFHSGYRIGDGEFAIYDGKLETRSLGEFRTGLKLPLLRDRATDFRRGELAKARIGRKLASLVVDQQKLVVLQSAIHRYWIWVANGRRLIITRDVFNIAETRQTLLELGVREGQIPAIEAVDNRRAILQRRSQLIEAERTFQQAAIELSLFYRGPDGAPVAPSLEHVPSRCSEPESLTDARIQEDQRLALQRRPEVDRFQATRDQMEVELQLAANARKPAVDLIAGFVNDSGSNPAVRRGPQDIKAGINFEVPLRNRGARGRQAAAEAKIRQLDFRAKFLREQIQAEVRDSAIAVEAARQRLAILTDEVRVSRELEEAERTRFELGEGTLFVLNLREQATADAAIRETLAEADFQRAMAAYEYATGALLDR